MFSLIITIVSIALVAAIALATLWFGGDMFGKGRQQADAAKLLNDISQIEGAVDLHRVDHQKEPETRGDLVPEYLNSLPVGWETSSSVHGYLRFTTAVSDETCMELNDRLGVENPDGSPPACDPAMGVDTDVSFKGCCIDPTL